MAKQAGPDPEQAVKEASDAFRAGNAARLARAASAVGGHVLEPWVGYWQLRLKLEDRSAEEIRWFLSRNDGTLLAEQLRRDWLKILGKQGEWALFREEAPRVYGDDAEVACYALLGRAQSGDGSAAAELTRFWEAARELPDGCAPLTEALLASGEWGPERVWQRFRILVEANHLSSARRLVAGLPRDQAPDTRQLSEAISNPIRFLERGLSGAARLPERELYIAAVLRAAREDPQLAMSYWDVPARGRYPASDQVWLLATLATAAARRHRVDAIAWFAEADRLSAGVPGAISDEQLAWRARIALRQHDWAEVQAAVSRMSSTGRAESAWVYWLGRALVALSAAPGQAAAASAAMHATAQQQFARIADEHSFYGRLAAEELGQSVRVPETAPAPTAQEIASTAANPGLQRALALYRIDLRREATREWNWAIRGMDDRSLLAAAQLALNNEVWDRAINTADRTVALHDFSVRYLAPYREEFADAARERDLEEPMVLGLVRQESRFITHAKSVVGASGLMQLMPATARWVAGKMGMKNYSWARAREPDMNIALGTFYLRKVLDDLDGHPVLAAAAYNAGPGRARRWRDARPLEGAIYAESIPFNETRDYVKKVMANTIYYSAVLGASARSLKSRLGVVAGR